MTYTSISSLKAEPTKSTQLNNFYITQCFLRFEAKGFKLVAIRMMRPGQKHLEEHYADLSKRPFFPGLVKYMDSGPVVAMCWEGEGVVKTGRVMLGETNPRDSKPGTIRGDYCIQVSQTQLRSG